MNYYKPTSLAQKIYKLLQLTAYALRIQFKPRGTKVKPKHRAILMVVPQLDRIGGLERQSLALSTALIRRGLLISVVTDRIVDSPASEFRSGFVIRRLPRFANAFRLLLALILFLFRQRNAYHIVHAHGVTGFTMISIFVTGWFGHRTVLKGATADDFAQIFQRNSLKHRLYRKTILSVDRLIAVSGQMSEEIVRCGIDPEKIRQIPNAVNSEQFSPLDQEEKMALRHRFSIPPDQPLFLFVGRLESRKGVDVLLHAWKKCSTGILWIVGSGPEEQNLKQLSNDLALTSVVFRGRSESPLDFYRCANLFVFPSLKEGLPGVMLEAMSCGLGCIATKIGGIVDQIQDQQQGLLVSPGSVDELAEAIQFAASHPLERQEWGRAAREVVVQRYELSRIAATYESLYSEEKGL